MSNFSSNHFYHIECFLCRKRTTEKETTTVCTNCGGPLETVFDYSHLKEQMNSYIMRNTPPRVIKYLDFYPLVERHSLVTLGEGGTPLQLCEKLGKKLGLNKLYIKNEGLNPTGAFKDRGSFVEINKARELGYKTVCVASTGNMAASVAAYSIQAGMTCLVFVPENTPRGKLAQAISYGANVICVRGTYSDAFNLAVRVAREYNYYLAGDYVFRGEGQKSLSYEVSEQLWFGNIDWMLVPVGMGTNLSYIYKGFLEYYKFGFIDKIPRMVAVQAFGASPLVEAFNNKKKLIPVAKPQTVCSAVAVGNPIDAPKVLEALKKTRGLAIAVSDDEALRAQQELSSFESLYVEPSSALTIGALKKLTKRGIIKSDDVVVCVATGVGLKDPATTLKVLAEPPTIEPVLSEAKRIIDSGVLKIRVGSVGDKEKIIFSSLPTNNILQKTIKEEFRLDLDIDNVKRIRNVLSKFIEIKGKKIAKADLQSIIETILQDERRKKTLEIADFHIETYKKQKPTATVSIRLNNHPYEVSANGVGPVDAAINAITQAIKKEDKTAFKLTDFNVEITTTGSDATVEVMMVMQDVLGNQAVEKGTSPDIIVAAIEAYEKGYNELVYQRSKNSKNH